MPNQTYDAIVVGSGISGGWAAKELTERGLKVLLLERGENIEHITGYTDALKAPWQLPHRGKITNQVREEQVAATQSKFIHEAGSSFWVKESESPYVQTKPFDWVRGYHVGGRSLMWGRQSYRWSPADFEANLKDSIGVDWPIRYEYIAPWYSYVEGFAGISGSLEGLPQLPDGNFLPPMELNCVEKDVAARIRSHYADSRRLIIGRVANLTTSHNGRPNCQYRSKCDLGCPFGAYFSTQSSTLPAALKTGNLTLRPLSIVTQILYDRDSKKATGVEVLDTETKLTTTFNAKIIFLCASSMNSAWILMQSARNIWPNGLGSSSGELGHNIMDHHYRVGASGHVEGFKDLYLYGRRANGFYIPRFRNLNGDKRDYIRGFAYQGSASRSGWQRDVAELGIGIELKESLNEPGAWEIGMNGFGEVLPRHSNKITVSKTKQDKWGLPVLDFDCALSDNEMRMRKDMIADAVEMLEIAGVTQVKPRSDPYALGMGIHEMGPARMGRDPKTSVLNKHNQVWDAQNVFVTDGACMASSACVNPSLTYMALTARAADFAVESLKKDDL
jgi:choline dehydrogenase-like flavoprotein